MDVIHNDIRDAIEKELTAAKERFPMFASLHEAIAVIAEETEESDEALKDVTEQLKAAWRCTRHNSTAALQCITRMRFAAERLAIEACQVAAMCEKAVQSAEVWKNGNHSE